MVEIHAIVKLIWMAVEGYRPVAAGVCSTNFVGGAGLKDALRTGIYGGGETKLKARHG